MKKLLVKDKVLKKLLIPLSILTKLERREAYLTNHKPKNERKEVRA